MRTRIKNIGLVAGGLLLMFGCSTVAAPTTNTEAVRQHADKAFHELKAQVPPPEQGDAQSPPAVSGTGDSATPPSPSVQKGIQIPLAEIGPTDGETIRATGYGPLAKGLTLCQHSADLAARVELSKLVRVQVTEKSVDRVRERTGKNFEQDIEVVREGFVNEVLSDVRIVDRKVDKEAGTCSSTAVIPKRNLFPTSGHLTLEGRPISK
ncbi:MAG TPA: hypothetical protein VKP13_04620 [Nitrospira sp.]|nr:hypothetical protein [Nitrospira sp.]